MQAVLAVFLAGLTAGMVLERTRRWAAGRSWVRRAVEKHEARDIFWD